MQFVNLTPFHSMAFQSLDLAGRYCMTVVTKAVNFLVSFQYNQVHYRSFIR